MNNELEKPEFSEASQKPEVSGGIFITKGMQIRIPSFELKLSNDGNIEPFSLQLQVGLDMCPYWLGIACDHLKIAEINHAKLEVALAESDDLQIGFALETEFSAAMQAITSVAFALDAFYEMVKERIDLSPELINSWRDNNTARNAQISEVISRAFTINADSKKQVREILKEIKRFRDPAVHPSAELKVPIYHPELKKHTEWRFVYYRFSNAKTLVSLGLSLVAQLSTVPKVKYPELTKYCEGLSKSLESLVEEWEEQYGILFQNTK